MARLPQPGGDEGTWGEVLNTYLAVSHDSTGHLKPDAVPSNALQDDSVSTAKLQDSSVTNTKLDTSNSPSSGQVLSYNGSSLQWANAGVGGDPAMGGDLTGPASAAQLVAGAVGVAELATNAVTTVKIADSNVTDAKLAGGIAQSKVTNLVTDLAGKQSVDGDLTAIAALTPSNDDVLQRKAGAWTNRTPAQVKTDLALTKSDVGLSNVDNTSDASKPVSTATQTALNAKVTANASITGATNTKITYDAKGLVTAGAVATQDDITDGVTYKQYSATEKTKLAGVATGATANSSDATLLSRANHTGTQTASTISDFNTVTDARADMRIAGASIDDLANVTLTAPANGEVLKYNGTTWVNGTDSTSGGLADGDKGDITVSGAGTVWTIDAAAVTGAKIAATTITDANISASAAIVQSKIQNLTSDLAGKQPIDADLTAFAGLTPTDDDILQRKAGAWINRTPAQVKTDLALTKTDVGLANVDNTSDADKPISTATQTALNAKAGSGVTITAGTGLTGGGDLSANRTISANFGTAAGTIAQGNDSRITGAQQISEKGGADGYASLDSFVKVPIAQIPTGTSATSVAIGNDSRIVGAEQAINKGAINGYASLDGTTKVPIAQLPTGSSATTVAIGNDSRITGAEQTANKGVASGYASLDGSIKVPIAQLPTGTSSTSVAIGNDSRITGAEQTANKGAASGYASLNSSTLVPTAQLGTGTADNTTFLRGDGTWATPAGGGGGGVTPINGGGETYYDAGNSSTAITLDLVNGNVQKLTLTGNCTITLTAPAAGAMRALTLLIFQDATGSRTITWPAAVKWGIAGAPVITTTALKMDMISLFTVDGGTNWYGALGAKGF